MSNQNEEKLKSRIDYFENEKGDCTITLNDEPIAICADTDSAYRLVGSYRAQETLVKALSKLVGDKAESPQ